MSAVTYLQRALLMHDLATLNGDEWEACFRKVLFPLMNKLLECGTDIDPSGLDETKMRSATLLSKVYYFHSIDSYSLSHERKVPFRICRLLTTDHLWHSAPPNWE